MIKKTFCFWLFLMCMQAAVHSQPILELVPHISGIDAPVCIRHAGDQRLFVVSKFGRILVADSSGTLAATPFLDLRQRVRASSNEQGLLGLAFHPNYKENGLFYVNYTFGSGDTRVSRFEVSAADSNLADPASEKVLLTVDQPFANHNGGDLHFGPDGYLYIALGDGGAGGDPQRHGQNRQSLLGKMLRIDVDTGDPYGIPPNNPFVNDHTTRDEIWALGLRNPWRFSFDRQTGDMWIGDVGQSEYEEISMQPAGSSGGENYGWRCYEGNSVFDLFDCPPASSLVSPIYAYDNTFSVGQSVTGGYVYRGSAFPLLQGHYVYGDYETGRMWSLMRNEQDAWVNMPHGQLLQPKQISAFGEDLKGELYVAAYSADKVYKIQEICSALIPVVEVENSMLSSSTQGVSYQWFLEQTPLNGATSQTLLPAQSGTYSVEVLYDNGCRLRSAPFVYDPTALEPEAAASIRIFPNPMREVAQLEFAQKPGQPFELRIYDLSGRLIRRTTGIRAASFTIRRQDLPPGMYLIEVRAEALLRGRLWVQD